MDMLLRNMLFDAVSVRQSRQPIYLFQILTGTPMIRLVVKIVIFAILSVAIDNAIGMYLKSGLDNYYGFAKNRLHWKF